MPKASTERRKLNKQLSIAEFEEHNHKSEPKMKLDGSRHVLSPRFFLALVTSQAIASDPSPLQDFCVADIDSPGMHALTLNNALYSCNKLQIKLEIFVRTDTVFLCLF